MKELTNKTGSVSTYYVLEELASQFRSYRLKRVLVRGLLFDEIRSLSGFLNNKYSLKQLIVSYSDAIRLEVDDGSEMDIEELELADFHNILLASSMFTTDDLTWTINKTCTNCGKKIVRKVEIDDIDYTQPLTMGLPIKLPNSDMVVSPLKVKDKIAIENDSNALRMDFKSVFEYEIDKESFDMLLSYAVSVPWDNTDHLLANINVLNNTPSLLASIKVANKDLDISLKPVSIKCKECGDVTYSRYKFDTLRGYL